MAEAGTDVDAGRLESYLSAELGVDVTGTEVLDDGINLIVGISTAAAEDAYVLRRPNKLRDTEYMLESRREYEVLRRLEDTPVPAPVPVTFCDDDSVLGDHFFVMTYLDGEVVPLGSDLPERFRNERSRRLLADQLIDTLAAVHSVAVEPFEDVCEYQSAREQVVHAADRFDEASSVTGHDVPALREVADWLAQHAPSESERTLLHGDFRPGNVLFAGTDRPELTGVLDWETAMVGDPLTELGYLLLRWRDDGDPTPSLDGIAARHSNEDVLRDLQADNENGLAPFTNDPGSPSRRELVARYEAKTGLTFEHDRFYRAHAAFTLATVWEDLHRYRVETGADSDWEPYVEYMTLLARSIAEGEFEL